MQRLLTQTTEMEGERVKESHPKINTHELNEINTKTKYKNKNKKKKKGKLPRESDGFELSPEVVKVWKELQSSSSIQNIEVLMD